MHLNTNLLGLLHYIQMFKNACCVSRPSLVQISVHKSDKKIRLPKDFGNELSI